MTSATTEASLWAEMLTNVSESLKKPLELELSYSTPTSEFSTSKIENSSEDGFGRELVSSLRELNT